ncbi:hypothetical protein BJ138DRAFT_788829 [Hygrophoropsis aurantiaca]|uniref:Uncharacterized protein n=1 Tax=Hygrophoropsis aurantiaca TaxID=72124 RepID=A0ACB8AGG3_9AGAM|nr:hypothetical protein BJ138DRAFT_788829 [Hygrophoropsis aurantiaca]
MNRTTHHPIFSLEEVFSIIFRYCATPSGSPCTTLQIVDYGALHSDYGTLASVARTCRSFHEPALDVLYSRVDIACLVQCLPQDLWYKDESLVLHFRRTMELQDWDHFLRYSRRVRTLSINPPFAINQNIFQALSHPLTNGSEIFPRLVDLEVIGLTNHDFASLLLTRNLTSLSIFFIEGDAIATNIIPSLSSTCPSLRRIKLARSGQYISNETVGAICEVLCKLPLLEDVDCPRILASDQVLSHLACLPSLKQLSIALPAYLPEKTGNSGTIFQTLRKLSLSSSEPQSCLQLLESVTSPCVESIVLSTAEVFSTEISRKLFTSISSHQSIMRIIITERSWSALPENYGIYLNILDPLLHLHNLQHLRLSSASTYSVDDATLSKMASAWPHLESLRLWPPKKWEAEARITLPGIIPLLQCCPKLCFFGTAVNAALPIADVSAYSACNHSKISLDVGASPILDPASVAAFLSCVMPNLGFISALDTSNMRPSLRAYGTRWKQVKAIIGIAT